VTGRPVRVIHIIGGGSRNRLLCRLTAQATGLPVQAGPVEATAIGNILLQALAMGEIASIAEGRQRVRRAFPPQACGSD
jgi:rhamnulokinase